MMRPSRVVEQQAAERLALFDKKVLASMDTLTSSGEDLLKVEPLNATAIASGLPAIQLSAVTAYATGSVAYGVAIVVADTDAANAEASYDRACGIVKAEFKALSEGRSKLGMHFE